MSNYRTTYDAWMADPLGFWAAAATAVDWIASPTESVVDPQGLASWFADGTCNVCWNAVDRHVVAGRGNEAALIYDSAILGISKTLTFSQLLDAVELFASVLRSHGVAKGDRVIIYMPMIPEAVIAMLACARLGAVHSVVFGGFAAHELTVRIDDAEPKVVVSASCGLEPNRIIAYKPLLDEAIANSRHKPEAVIVLQRPQLLCELRPERDYDWNAEWSAAITRGDRPECVEVRSTDPLYILYTSGTTGKPKGVVRQQGGYMVALVWSMKNVFGIGAGDVYWAASDLGWVVGHSYITYGPLLAGCATVIFEGKPVGTPDASTFWRVISQHKVNLLFTAPTALRAIRKEDAGGVLPQKFDLSSLRAIYIGGERGDPSVIKWAESALDVPVLDNWWQTETGWPMTANPSGLGTIEVKYGSAAVPMPGYDIQILDAEGEPAPIGETGSIAVKLPLPPGALQTLWNNHGGFEESYLTEFPGYYKTGDAGYIDQDGYVFIMSRTDDIINVAGHRLSTGSIEEAISTVDQIAECAVVGVADGIKGEVPLVLFVVSDGASAKSAEISALATSAVRSRIGSIATPKIILSISRLPKTRSGKILRSTIRKIANGEPWTIPPTIEDPSVLDEVSAALAGVGLPEKLGTEGEI
ncbi:AMP-binding protein [Sphingomonas histidinilytica]|jgi:propionyl-CoA synthetase|uniref:Propionyl-CoA synthetase n=1 Tax=Sphingobium wenxiniae (strain DSM 21828 / CGMCC 1.7748 / JZ-1) TaxID=595605 RepID=A0A562JWI5_SPHWJ|nr:MULTISPECIES: AMP-binding protein [Sphingomonadaceae]MBB6193841.1 propionyl-CoA synthetase [Sphingobium wenxiniae]MBO9380833.1 AMP-binding protein [Rhizorhabdus histidinilytica]TAJ79431.1 MAG: propionyl-CoA synthetase [Sphingobium sp.]TWH87529.1 propionyl-CoA synthetase [Sphingobium wenxiniae]